MISIFCIIFFHFTMSIRRWNTSFEREQLKKLTHTNALYESSTVPDHGNDDMSMLMSDSSSSSSSSASSSSSSSLSSSSLSSLHNMNRIEEDDELLNLVITTQQLNRKFIRPLQIIMCDGENVSTFMTYQSPSV